MLLEIETVLNAEALARFHEVLERAPWGDGRATAGYQSALAKNNHQLPEDCEASRMLGGEILDALNSNLIFQSAALPARIFPPLFNRYGPGQAFAAHVDNAMRLSAQTQERIRTDLSATLFLSEPDTYDGGELVIDGNFGAQSVKLKAGDMILYPSTSLHGVNAVTRGARVAAVFWVQSLVRDDACRDMLFDLDMSIQRLRADVEDAHPSLITLTGVYHNLVRRWGAP